MRNLLKAFLAVLVTLNFVDLASAQESSKPIDLLEGISGYRELSPAEIANEMGWSDESTITPIPTGTPRVRIIVDKAQRTKAFNRERGDTNQTMRVYVDGVFMYQFDVSTGAEIVRCPDKKNPKTCHVADTPVGSWRIQKNRRYVEYRSKTWNDARMPYAQFYDRGWAIHGTTPDHYNMLGRRDSGGCTRLHLDNAIIMFALVDEYGAQNSEVTIFDSTAQMDPTLTLSDLIEATKPISETRANGLPYIY